jgi:TPR repeat protein
MAYAWLKVAGRYFVSMDAAAEGLAKGLTPAQLVEGNALVTAFDRRRTDDGAYYTDSDPLRDPGMKELEVRLNQRSDPDEQLRLAFYYEVRAPDPAAIAKALGLKIGMDYELGREGFPMNLGLAATWYGFAMKAGSAEAAERQARVEKEQH